MTNYNQPHKFEDSGVSNCCKAKLVVLNGREGTNHYICSNCNHSCDSKEHKDINAPKPMTTIEEMVDDLEPYFKPLYVSGSFDVFNLKTAIKQTLKDYGDAVRAEERNKIYQDLKPSLDKLETLTKRLP